MTITPNMPYQLSDRCKKIIDRINREELSLENLLYYRSVLLSEISRFTDMMLTNRSLSRSDLMHKLIDDEVIMPLKRAVDKIDTMMTQVKGNPRVTQFSILTEKLNNINRGL